MLGVCFVPVHTCPLWSTLWIPLNEERLLFSIAVLHISYYGVEPEERPDTSNALVNLRSTMEPYHLLCPTHARTEQSLRSADGAELLGPKITWIADTKPNSSFNGDTYGLADIYIY